MLIYLDPLKLIYAINGKTRIGRLAQRSQILLCDRFNNKIRKKRTEQEQKRKLAEEKLKEQEKKEFEANKKQQEEDQTKKAELERQRKLEEQAKKKRQEEQQKQQEVKQKKSPEATKKTYMHNIICDSFNVCLTKRTMGKDFMQDLSISKTMEGQSLTFIADDMITVILYCVTKRKNQNKFRMLYNAYSSAKSHLLANKVDIEEVLNYICSYFAILYSSPEALEIETTEKKQQIKAAAPALPNIPPNMGDNPQMMAMMQMLMQAQAQGGAVFEETFTNIEDEFFDVVVNDGLLISDKEFMANVLEECKDEAFDLIIRKSFLLLDNLNELKTLTKALSIVNVIGSHDELAEEFINHKYFIPVDGNLTGKRLQMETFFGRMLSITVWPTENSNKNFDFNMRMTPGLKSKQVDTMSEKFYAFYDGFTMFMKKLLKNKATKNRALEWFRMLINLNTDYFKMMPQFASLSSKSVFLNSIAIFLELSTPFVSKMDKFQTMFDKIDPLYCATEKHLKLGS